MKLNTSAPAGTVAMHWRRARARAAAIGVTLAALLALAAPAATAADQAAATQQSGAIMYGVELIVFRVASVNANEDWDAVPPGRGFGGTATRAGATAQVLRVLAPADYRLGTLEATLKTSGAWRPVAHAAWIQSASSWGTHVGIALSDVGVNVPGLSGQVYLERAPIYLHLGFDVHLTAGATYSIKEMRSVRYNDKQYFDHPGFGIIAMVTPIKRGAAAATP